MKKKTRLRLTSLLAAIAIMLSLVSVASPVSAAETSSSENATANVAEAKELRQKLNAALGETAATRASYKTDYWGYCTVVNTHQGGYHTIYGNRARLAVAFKPLDGNTALSTYLSTGFGSWSPLYQYNSVDADGYCMFVSDWKNITYQKAYSLYYKIWTTGNGGYCDGRRAHFHVWVDYQ